MFSKSTFHHMITVSVTALLFLGTVHGAECLNGRLTWETGESHLMSLNPSRLNSEVVSVKMVSNANDAPIPDFTGVIGTRIAFRLETKCRTLYSGEFNPESRVYKGDAWCTTPIGMGLKASWILSWGECPQAGLPRTQENSQSDLGI